MPSLPSVGQKNWGGVLNDALSTVLNSSSGGLNITTSLATINTDFPSPQENTTVFVKNENKIYRRQSGVWVEKINFSSNAASSTPPTSPSLGDTYYNTTDGRLYVWNGTSWIAVGQTSIIKNGTFATGTSQNVTDSEVTVDTLVDVYVQGTAAGIWTVESFAGSFTITSTDAETNVAFKYIIHK